MDRIDITKKVFKHHKIRFDSPHFFGFWELGYSFVKIKDSDYSFTDLCGDTYCPEVNNDIDPAQLKREKEAFRRRVKKEGVYGCGLALNGVQLFDHMVWGFVGNDYLGSGYDSEHLHELAVRAAMAGLPSTFNSDAGLTKTDELKYLSLRDITEKAKLLDCIDGDVALDMIKAELLTDMLVNMAATDNSEFSAFARNILKTYKNQLTISGSWERAK